MHEVEIVIIVALVLSAFLYAQHRHYEHVKTMQEMEKRIEENVDLTQAMKDLADYKKRVDTLSLKAGLRL
jgi:cell division protein FtsL